VNAPGLIDQLNDAAQRAGLVAIGVAAVEPFADTREVLETRKAEGLHGGMAFTYRDPERSTDPARILAGARSLVVGAFPYSAGPVSDPSFDGPAGRVARYAITDHYASLRSALDEVATVLEDAGHRTRVVLDDNALVDRAAAPRAGLGWFGHNANLLVPGYGSWVVLGSIVTDADLFPTDAERVDGVSMGVRPEQSSPLASLMLVVVLRGWFRPKARSRWSFVRLSVIASTDVMNVRKCVRRRDVVRKQRKPSTRRHRGLICYGCSMPMTMNFFRNSGAGMSRVEILGICVVTHFLLSAILPIRTLQTFALRSKDLL
jgi:hypothetical protein